MDEEIESAGRALDALLDAARRGRWDDVVALAAAEASALAYAVRAADAEACEVELARVATTALDARRIDAAAALLASMPEDDVTGLSPRLVPAATAAHALCAGDAELALAYLATFHHDNEAESDLVRALGAAIASALPTAPLLAVAATRMRERFSHDGDVRALLQMCRTRRAQEDADAVFDICASDYARYASRDRDLLEDATLAARRRFANAGADFFARLRAFRSLVEIEAAQNHDEMLARALDEMTVACRGRESRVSMVTKAKDEALARAKRWR